MSRVTLTLFVILALFLSVGTAVAQVDENRHDDIHTVTDEDTGIPVPMFMDGRLNAADLAAPVVIYYTWEKQPVLDEFGNQVWGDQGGLFFRDIVTGIDVLSINQDTGFVSSALHVGVDDIKAMVENASGVDCCVAENGPISLHYSQSGWFWVEAPEREGKLYTFQWEGFDF